MIYTRTHRVLHCITNQKHLHTGIKGSSSKFKSRRLNPAPLSMLDKLLTPSAFICTLLELMHIQSFRASLQHCSHMIPCRVQLSMITMLMMRRIRVEAIFEYLLMCTVPGQALYMHYHLSYHLEARINTHTHTCAHTYSKKL